MGVETAQIKSYKKTGNIQAVQFTDDAFVVQTIIDWAASFGVHISLISKLAAGGIPKPFLMIPTVEGPMYAAMGDYIAKGVENEFWAINPHVFGKTYTEV